MIILKVIKKQGFAFSVEDKKFEMNWIHRYVKNIKLTQKFVYKFHCAQELTEGFTDINVLNVTSNTK